MGYAEEPEAQTRVSAFLQGLRETGWTDGRNVRIDYRWAAGDVDRTHKYAAELVALAPDVILATGTPVTAAVLQQTRTIPVVFVDVGDPVGSGLVASFARPGGNATGFNNLPLSIASKWLELLKEIAPRTQRVAYLFNPATAPFVRAFLSPLNAAAPSIGVEVVASPVDDASAIDRLIAALARDLNGGLIVLPSTFVLTHRDLIIALAAQHRLPAMYAFRGYTKSGGLSSYGSVPTDGYHRAAAYIDRILRGDKPADLPVQAPVKFELVINVKTAKAMGLIIPESVLLRADEVIE
jgi:putative ABC transport system substrate-binding protein